MYCYVCIAKSRTEVAFGQGNSSYARSFLKPKSSSGIHGRYLSSLFTIMNRSLSIVVLKKCISLLVGLHFFFSLFKEHRIYFILVYAYIFLYLDLNSSLFLFDIQMKQSYQKNMQSHG